MNSPSGLPSWVRGQDCSQKEAVVSPAQDSEGAEMLLEGHQTGTQWYQRNASRNPRLSSCSGLPDCLWLP